MKTELTRTLEVALLNYCEEAGQFGIEEVTMPKRLGIVDMLSYQLKTSHNGRGKPITFNPIWRCYEIKSSKADFYSRAKKTFIGHYNYYVMPQELYEIVKKDIPEDIGVFVLVYEAWRNPAHELPYTLSSFKRAKSVELKLSHDEIYRQYIGSMHREVNKARRIILENKRAIKTK